MLGIMLCIDSRPVQRVKEFSDMWNFIEHTPRSDRYIAGHVSTDTGRMIDERALFAANLAYV